MFILVGTQLETPAIISFAFLCLAQLVKYRFSILLTQLSLSVWLFNFISFSLSSLLSTIYDSTPFPFHNYAFAPRSVPFNCSAFKQAVVSKVYMTGTWETLPASPCSSTSDESAACTTRQRSDESHGYSNWNLFLKKTSNMESFRTAYHSSQSTRVLARVKPGSIQLLRLCRTVLVQHWIWWSKISHSLWPWIDF